MKKIIILSLFAIFAVKANAITTVSINAPSGTPNTCSSYTYTSTITSFGADVYDSYLWTITDGLILGSATSTSVTVIWKSSVTQGTLKFDVNYHNGSFFGVASNTIIVAVNGSPNTSPPIIVGALSGNPNFIAVGATSITFSVPAIPNVSSYSWTYPSCFTAASATTTIPQITFTATGSCSGSVCVKGLNTICATYSPTTCIAITRVPTISGITGSNTSCSTTASTYSIPHINGISTYTWTVPAGFLVNGIVSTTGIVTLPAPTGASINVAPPTANTGDKTISVYGSVAGIGNTNTQSLLVTFGVPSQPIYLTSNIVLACLPINVPWGIQAVPNATSYTWSTTSSVVSLTPSGLGCEVDIITAGVGPRVIKVQANNACGTSVVRSATMGIKTTGCGGVRSLLGETVVSEENSITTYPNPANDNLLININSTVSGQYTITLYDINGKKVTTLIKNVEIGSNETMIDVSQLSNGLYFLNIDNGIEIQKQKISIVH
jgi:large repetitive protein